MNAVDTNVLIYVNDSRDPGKQAIAASLVANLTEGVLVWQVACEYLAASRKLELLGYNRVQAYQYIRDLQQVWYTALPTWTVIDRAEDLMGRFSLSHWDSMVIAACLEANVETLYTEDFGYSDIFVPDDCAKDFIKMELFDVFRREMIEKIFRKTPGLLFTDKNLGVLNPARDRWVYLSLEPYIQERASQRLPRFFRRMEETIKDSDDLLKEISGSRWRLIWEVMKDTIMLEPNFSGVGVDLKAARSRFLVTANIN